MDSPFYRYLDRQYETEKSAILAIIGCTLYWHYLLTDQLHIIDTSPNPCGFKAFFPIYGSKNDNGLDIVLLYARTPVSICSYNKVQPLPLSTTNTIITTVITLIIKSKQESTTPQV